MGVPPVAGRCTVTILDRETFTKSRKIYPPQLAGNLLYYSQHTPVSLRRESAALKVRGVFFTMTKLPSYSKPALTVGEQVKLLIGRGLVCAGSSGLRPH